MVSDAQAIVDEVRAIREAEAARSAAIHVPPSVTSPDSQMMGLNNRTIRVPCLFPSPCNECMPKDYMGPHKVPNYVANVELAV